MIIFLLLWDRQKFSVGHPKILTIKEKIHKFECVKIRNCVHQQIPLSEEASKSGRRYLQYIYDQQRAYIWNIQRASTN